MELSTRDCLMKALLDTQERVRDFKNYSEQLEDQELKEFFSEYAEQEGMQASQLREFINNDKS